ncbi:MAG: hypothetical protein M1820_005346 [Bogoriella megaspora]|nr:MAG: hypothetical protein M1820_005346 [Bogoriella megaspora]
MNKHGDNQEAAKNDWEQRAALKRSHEQGNGGLGKKNVEVYQDGRQELQMDSIVGIVCKGSTGSIWGRLPSILPTRQAEITIGETGKPFTMFTLPTISVAMRLLLLTVPASLISAAPAAAPAGTHQLEVRQGSGYWLADIKHQGKIFNGTEGYTIFRNVKDSQYGAVGDGNADDTEAINKAMSDGTRCGLGCDSDTKTPAIVYFPAGTYKVTKPIQQYYFTQMIGDPTNPPTIKADASFTGMAVVDSDPYEDSGANWFVNQNNFYRQIRNFVIDITALPSSAGACIHWQVAQATSLQNIVFNMVKDTSPANQQKGVFMDNGSGGFMTNLTFNNGGFGAWLGNQQFTTRDLVFNGCNTAFFMNWNWGWTLKSATINNAQTAIDISSGTTNQSVGSLIVLDTTISNTPIGINTSFALNPESAPVMAGTLYLENVDMSQSVPTAVQDYTGTKVLDGNTVIKSWGQGSSVTGSSASRIQKTLSAPSKDNSLLANGKIFERSKPQYETLASSSFVSVLGAGAVGDGNTDDTAAIQKAMDSIQDGQVLFFDHGFYRVTDTIKVPKNIKIVGEVWPVIAANGTGFGDPTKPKPVFQVGQPGDSGAVEMSDLVFGNMGPAPGAVLIEWNLQSQQGASGLWDVHARVGGYNGTNQGMNCYHDNATQFASKDQTYKTDCQGVFLMMHITSSASNTYLENTWFWTADHSLDTGGSPQIDIYTGRGVLIESAGPTWLYGTASEHSVLYNYQLNNAKNLFMGMIQTETPYFQPNPVAPNGISGSLDSDPKFSCTGDDTTCDAWGLRIVNSSGINVYGGGLYSFFNNYGQDCLTADPQNCQQNMVAVDGSSDIHLFALSTKASVNMVTENDGQTSDAKDADNRGTFAAVLLEWTDGGSTGGSGSPAPAGSSSAASSVAAPSSAAASSAVASSAVASSAVASSAVAAPSAAAPPAAGPQAAAPQAAAPPAANNAPSPAGSPAVATKVDVMYTTVMATVTVTATA